MTTIAVQRLVSCLLYGAQPYLPRQDIAHDVALVLLEEPNPVDNVAVVPVHNVWLGELVCEAVRKHARDGKGRGAVVVNDGVQRVSTICPILARKTDEEFILFHIYKDKGENTEGRWKGDVQ